jgi:hypothetical protein
MAQRRSRRRRRPRPPYPAQRPSAGVQLIDSQRDGTLADPGRPCRQPDPVMSQRPGPPPPSAAAAAARPGAGRSPRTSPPGAPPSPLYRPYHSTMPETRNLRAIFRQALSGVGSRHGILDKLRCCPWRAGKLAKAINALEVHGALPGWNQLNDPQRRRGYGSDGVNCGLK